MNRKRSKKAAIADIFIYILAFLWLVPLLFMVVATFKEHNSIIYDIRDWFSPPFTLENYQYVFEKAPIIKWMVNSFLVAALTTIGVILVSAPAAFGLTIRKSRLSALIAFLLLAGMMIPAEAMLVPLFTLCMELKLLNNLPSLILPFLAAPLSVMLIMSAFESLPKELFEAAQLDGCGNLRMLAQIAVPLVKPTLATVAILTFLGNWNSFMWPFISITDETFMTITVGLPYFKSSGMGDGFQLPMTASLVSVIPVIIFFFIFQKFIMEGIGNTGNK